MNGMGIGQLGFPAGSGTQNILPLGRQSLTSALEMQASHLRAELGKAEKVLALLKKDPQLAETLDAIRELGI